MEQPFLGPFEASFLVVGITQIIKDLFEESLSSKATLAIALTVGLIVLSFAEIISAGYVTPETAAIIVSVFKVIGWTISVPGWYSVVSNKITQLS